MCIDESSNVALENKKHVLNLKMGNQKSQKMSKN